MKIKHSPGERITELRKTYAVSRETLAERSGLDVELIRCIEEAGLIPGLAPLIKIARALGVRLGTLMDDHEELGPVITRAAEVEAAARFVTGRPEKRQGLNFKTLAADKGGRHMEPFIVDIEGDAAPEKSTHEGEEFVLVLSGSLALDYGAQREVLEPGDSAYYDSIVPHRLLPADKKPVRILAVIYTPA